MVTCNTTHSELLISEEPIWKSLTFHHLGLILSATFGLLSLVISLWLIAQHASHYSKPWEQKHIIRILFMIPIYATVSFLSYVYYQHAIYFEVLRDCYEAFAIASFFTLMCHYIAPNLHEQKEYFRNIEVKNWLWPMNWVQKCTGGEYKGAFRKPISGLTWFNIVWISIFQYCFIRVFFTIVSVVSQVYDRYCEASLHPEFAHLWVMVFEGLSVTVAMYCLIQFYYQLKQDLAPYRPFLKILCIKLVIFFCFWQSLLISFLTSDDGALKPTKKIAYPDLKIGIPSMLICVEMAIFAALHVWAFSWKPYDLANYQTHPNDFTEGNINNTPKSYAYGPVRALASVFNPWDIIKATGRGFRWLFVGVRHRKDDISYQKKLGSFSGDTRYHPGPTFAGNGEAATEMKTGKEGLHGKNGFDDSDTAGLLSHSQANPYGKQDVEAFGYNPYAAHNTSPYQLSSNPDALPTAPTPHDVGWERERPPSVISYVPEEGRPPGIYPHEMRRPGQ